MASGPPVVFDGPGNFSYSVEPGRRLRVDSALAVREAVLAGAGIGLCPSFVVGEDLAEGRLQAVLRPHEAHALGVFVIYPHRRHLPAKVRAFVDFMAAEYAPATTRL